MTYQLTTGDTILRLADNAFIPQDPANTDYAAYLKWKEAGNTPLPAPAPPKVAAFSRGIPESHIRVFHSNPCIVKDTDKIILLDLPTNEEPNVLLPDPTTCEGRELRIKNYHAAVARSAVENVRANKNYAKVENMLTGNVNGAWVTLVSDGTYWVKLQSYPCTDQT